MYLDVPTAKARSSSKNKYELNCSNENIANSDNNKKEVNSPIFQNSTDNLNNMSRSNSRNTLNFDTNDSISIASGQSHQLEALSKGSSASQIPLEGKRTIRKGPFIPEDKNKSKISVENRLTRISLGIVYLFIVCHVWRLIPTAYEALFSKDGTVISEWPKWLIHVYHLSHTLIVFNSAVNFILYVVR